MPPFDGPALPCPALHVRRCLPGRGWCPSSRRSSSRSGCRSPPSASARKEEREGGKRTEGWMLAAGTDHWGEKKGPLNQRANIQRIDSIQESVLFTGNDRAVENHELSLPLSYWGLHTKILVYSKKSVFVLQVKSTKKYVVSCSSHLAPSSIATLFCFCVSVQVRRPSPLLLLCPCSLPPE